MKLIERAKAAREWVTPLLPEEVQEDLILVELVADQVRAEAWRVNRLRNRIYRHFNLRRDLNNG